MLWIPEIGSLWRWWICNMVWSAGGGLISCSYTVSQSSRMQPVMWISWVVELTVKSLYDYTYYTYGQGNSSIINICYDMLHCTHPCGRLVFLISYLHSNLVVQVCSHVLFRNFVVTATSPLSSEWCSVLPRLHYHTIRMMRISQYSLNKGHAEEYWTTTFVCCPLLMRGTPFQVLLQCWTHARHWVFILR